MSRPNVLFIVTDDQGPWAYGSAGDPDAQTPNLDRLCNEGARLTNYFCMSPVCSAARSCLMTSRYTTETGIHDYLSPMESDVGLDPAFATWPRCLEDAGYATALVGKWHLGKGAKYHPTQHGYQEYFGEMVGCSVDPTVEVGGVPRVVEGYTPDVTADFGIDFIRRVQRRDDTPFLLSLHFFAPHANTANRTPEGDRTWLPVSEEDWAPFCDID
ncbi:MAG: sulfatase-like hydrolase/transferase, partial [Candidatus Latescibacteria bacterium]|nr:sulfatase-like hydrolase/transferase [Candidatus Latescibacterota bacterium]